MIYRDPRSGQTQDVAERETVLRQLLEQAGWVVVDVSQETLAPATVRIGDELVVLPPGAQPAARAGFKLVEVTSNDSDVAEFIEAPEDAPSSKRKRSK